MKFLCNNKRGSQYVEAAIVMPITVTMMICCIYIILFFYSFVWSRCETHEELIRYSERTDELYEIKSKLVEEQSLIKGLTDFEMSKSEIEKIYILNNAKAVRLGDNFDVF